MSIIFKVILGVVVLCVLALVALLVCYVAAVMLHEQRWRNDLSDDYKMYNDEEKQE